jgi:hypothetical protein
MGPNWRNMKFDLYLVFKKKTMIRLLHFGLFCCILALPIFVQPDTCVQLKF